MQHKENCNLTFLNTGKGKPFNVGNFSTSQEMIDYVAELLTTAPWKVFIVRADSLLTLVFQQPGRYHYKTKLIDHNVCEVLNGQYSEGIYKYLSTKLESNKFYAPKLSDEVIEQISSGYLGTFALFGDESVSGLLNHQSQATLVLDQLPAVVVSPKNTVDSHLMQGVIRLIEQSIIESKLELTADTRAKVITAAYNYAVRTQASANSLDPHGILAILDSIVEWFSVSWLLFWE